MNRISYMILKNILIFPYLYFKLLYLVKSKKATYEQKYNHLRKITECANRAGKVKIESYGIENIPKEDGYMLYPNHQCMYDVLTIIATHERPFAVVMKKDLQNIPLLCRVFEAMGAIAIDREDIKQSLKVIIEVSKEVKNGRNFLIFAEGTRSRNGNKVGEFKGGSFKAATKAKSPIVPVALVDAFKPFDEKTLQEVNVKVCYLKPIPYEEYKEMSSNEIAKLVEERIQNKIDELTGEKH